MSYQKNNWQSGDVVTSAKLNRIEDGIAAGGKTIIVCHVSFDQETGMATITNLGSAFDALDAIAADMSLAEKYALVVTGLDDFLGGESSFFGGYCNTSVFYTEKQYKSAFINVDNNGVNLIIVRDHLADIGVVQYQYLGIVEPIERNALDEAGNYVWEW